MHNMQDWTQGGADIRVGECLFLADSTDVLLTLDNMTFLKSGSLIVDDQANYSEAYANFAVDRPKDFSHFVTTDDGVVGVDELLFTNGKYVFTVRKSGNVLPKVVWSTDGKNWNTTTPGFDGNIYGIAYFNTRYVVCGFNANYDRKLFAYSTDLINWSFWTDPSVISPAFCMGHLPGIIVGLGAYDVTYNPNNILYSTDGIAFNRTNSTNLRIQSLRCDNLNNTLIAQGIDAGNAVKVSTSTNGTTWAANTTIAALIAASGGASLSGAAYGAGIYVVTVYEKLYSAVSLAGPWTQRLTSDVDAFSFISVIHDGTKFIAVSTDIHISYNGIDWIKTCDRVAADSLQGVAMSTSVDPFVIFTSAGQAHRMAPIKAVGVLNHVEQDGMPLYMRVK